MSFLGPRHSTIDAEPRAAAQQNSENARDTQQALGAKLTARTAVIARYTAAGSTSTRIPLVSPDVPFAVLLVRAADAAGLDQPLAATGNANFLWDAASRSLNVYEPGGLVAGTIYRLSYLLIGV